MKIKRISSFGFVVPLLVFLFIFSSCQKEITGEIETPSTTPTNPTTPTTPAVDLLKVKTYSEDVTIAAGGHFIETFNVTYDSNDRILSLISVTSTGNKIMYSYSTNNYTMDIYEADVLSIHSIFYLNSIPFVDSSVQHDFSTNDTITQKYTYNTSKQLATLKSYAYSKATGSTLFNTYTYTYDANGNLVKEVDNSNTTTYDYYTDIPNNINIGMIYFYQSRNMIKTTTESKPGGVLINHTYTLDSNKRITSEKDVYSNGNVVIKSFTY